MKFRYTILYVDDVQATLKFYEAAFGMSIQMLHEAGDYGVLETGQTQLAFSSNSLMASGGIDVRNHHNGHVFEIGLETNDVQGAFDRAVENGATPKVEVQSKPWGQEVGYVTDLNGFLIEICSPVQSP